MSDEPYKVGDHIVLVTNARVTGIGETVAPGTRGWILDARRAHFAPTYYYYDLGFPQGTAFTCSPVMFRVLSALELLSQVPT